MKPPPFKYFAPTTLDETLDLLAEYGDEAKPLAGGQSLIPTMNFRLALPGVLIDLNRLTELAFIEPSGDGGVSVGAMTRQRAVERSSLIAERAPLVHETMPWIAHPQIRNRGTFGGSLAHSDPAAELPAVTAALSARFKAKNSRGERWIPADDFFVDLFETALGPDELLVEVVLPPLAARTGYAFREVSRRHGDYALVGVAAAVTLAEDDVCQQARLVYFSVGDKPTEAFQAAAALHGQKLSREAITEAAHLAAQHDLDPPADIHASVRYRRHLAQVVAKDVLEKAHQRAKRNQ
jgi:carbon-monoxide dehydrogenase medium subunit